METEKLLARMHGLGGPSSDRQAERVLRASLSALARYLPACDRARLARALPTTLRDALENDLFAAEPSPPALGAEVARACQLDARFGVEQLEVACRVVAEHLSAVEREGLQHHLPELLAPLLSLPETRPAAPSHSRRVLRAKGREGSAAATRVGRTL